MHRQLVTRAAAALLILCGLQNSADVRAAESGQHDSRILKPSAERQMDTKKSSSAALRSTAGRSWWTTGGGLVAVLALIFVATKVVRKSVPSARASLPAEVVQVLGRKAIDYRHAIHLVRCGSRLLVLGSSQEGLRTLSEITDPVEIDYLAGLCKPSQPASVAQSFGQLFRRFHSPLRGDTDDDLSGHDAAGHEDVSGPDSDRAVLSLQARLEEASQSRGAAGTPDGIEEAG